MKFLIPVIFMMIASCGYEESENDYPTPPAKPSEGWNEVKIVLKDNCVRCHSSSAFVISGSGFKSSTAGKRAGNGTMPPPASPEGQSITDDERLVLSSFK